MIERHAISDTPATIVPYHRELFVPERPMQAVARMSWTLLELRQRSLNRRRLP